MRGKKYCRCHACDPNQRARANLLDTVLKIQKLNFTLIPGNALVTRVRKVLFSHLSISQQCLRLATVASLEDRACECLACSARNMR